MIRHKRNLKKIKKACLENMIAGDNLLPDGQLIKISK